MSTSKIKISRILHAGFIFEVNDTKVLFDPIFENPFSQNCYAFPEIEFKIDVISHLKWDAVFISHYHDDHFSLESLKQIDRKTPIYFFSVFEEMFDLIKTLGFTEVHPIQIGQDLRFKNLKITPLEALDTDVDSIFHIEYGDLHLLHVVDSWIGPNTWEKIRNIKKWDLVLWPFQTMREMEVIAPSIASIISEETTQLPVEWKEQIESLSPRVIVPSSCQFKFEDWSWYNQAFFPISYKNFKTQIQNILPQTSVIKLAPGETLELTKDECQKIQRLDWILPTGDPETDYEFNPHHKPQSLSEIAQKLPPLNSNQKNEIHYFLKNDLSIRYEGLSELEDFRPMIWKLLVYTEQGNPVSYVFKVQEQSLSASSEEDADWITEISEYKLYQALFHGESLTSIYIRITPTTDSDLFKDPLIRALYEGIIGGYQKAQLKKILSKP